MRYLLPFLLIFLNFSLHAQTILDEKEAIRFIDSAVNALDVKIWNAVMSKDIKAYWTDSLNREMTIQDIKVRGGRNYLMQSENLIEAEDDKDTFVLFENSGDLTGLSLSFTQIFSENEISTSYHLHAIAPLFMLFVSGADLCRIPLFWIDVSSFESVLTSDEYKFYKALFHQRMQIGDINDIRRFDRHIDTVEFYLNELISKDLIYSNTFGNVLQLSDSFIHLMGAFNQKMPAYALANVFQPNRHYLDSDTFLNTHLFKIYRDVGLKNAYTSFENCAPAYVTLQLDWNNDYVEGIYTDYFSIIRVDQIAFHKVNSNAKIQLHYAQQGETPSFDIFFRFNDLIPFMKPHDVIVLQAIMKQIK